MSGVRAPALTGIVLHTAELDNAGVRRDAGTALEVGTGKRQITAAHARALIERHAAAVNAPAA